jgi:uracil-DNA glycosylase family 4
MLISDAPAAQTDIRYGEPLIGEAGRELDALYLPALGLTRNQVYITTAAKCLFEDGARGPYPAEVSACAQRNLWREICQVNPDLIIPMGAAAVSLFGKHLNQDHGIASYAEVQDGNGGDWAGFVIPTYHPNAGFTEDRGSQFISAIHYDMQSAAEFLQTMAEVQDEYPEPDYREITTPAEFWDYVGQGPDADAGGIDCAVDTESDTALTRRRPPAWSAQFTVRPGTGVIVRRRHADVFAQVDAWFNLPRGLRPRAVYHSALADLGTVAELGFTTPRFTDTLQMATILGLPSRGLKYLCRRYLGMPMANFWDVVIPPSRKVTEAYLREFLGLYTAEWAYIHTFKQSKTRMAGETETRWERYILTDADGAPDPETGEDIKLTAADAWQGHSYLALGAAKKALKNLRKHQDTYWDDGLETLTVVRAQPPRKSVYNKVSALMRALDRREALEDPGEDSDAVQADSGPAAGVLDDDSDVSGAVNPWDRWDGWTAADREYIQTMTGQAFTYPSIAFCRPQDATRYACRDTDGTLRLYRVLRGLFRVMRRR